MDPGQGNTSAACQPAYEADGNHCMDQRQGNTSACQPAYEATNRYVEPGQVNTSAAHQPAHEASGNKYEEDPVWSRLK